MVLTPSSLCLWLSLFFANPATISHLIHPHNMGCTERRAGSVRAGLRPQPSPPLLPPASDLPSCFQLSHFPRLFFTQGENHSRSTIMWLQATGMRHKNFWVSSPGSHQPSLSQLYPFLGLACLPLLPYPRGLCWERGDERPLVRGTAAAKESQARVQERPRRGNRHMDSFMLAVWGHGLIFCKCVSSGTKLPLIEFNIWILKCVSICKVILNNFIP